MERYAQAAHPAKRCTTRRSVVPERLSAKQAGPILASSLCEVGEVQPPRFQSRRWVQYIQKRLPWACYAEGRLHARAQEKMGAEWFRAAGTSQPYSNRHRCLRVDVARERYETL